MIIQFQNEIPLGLINGINKIYTVGNNPVQVFQNGQLQILGIDYSVSGSSAPYTITYTNAPLAGNHLSLY